MPDDLKDTERDKYRRVWTHDVYRKVSPGMIEAEAAFHGLGCKTGDVLYDWGCGEGKATSWFQDQSLVVVGIDIADNAVSTPVPFVEACLWDVGLPIGANFAFCCDVLEHIPPEKVDATVANIARHTSDAAWFRIATRPDALGPKLIGAPLHLTVRDWQWWADTLSDAWPAVDLVRENGRDAVFLCQR